MLAVVGVTPPAGDVPLTRVDRRSARLQRHPVRHSRDQVAAAARVRGRAEQPVAEQGVQRDRALVLRLAALAAVVDQEPVRVENVLVRYRDVVDYDWLTTDDPCGGLVPFAYQCASCGKEFVRLQRVTLARVFCSRDCYHAATIVHQERRCPQCGLTFRPSRDENKLKSFCTWACYDASRSRVTKICAECGSEFTVSASTASRYRRCSRGCGTIYVNCERCGKRFRAEKTLNRHFCSEECRRPPVLLTCRNCGTEFRTVPSLADERRFCTRRCYRSFTGETALEARIREALAWIGLDMLQEHQIGPWTLDFASIPHRINIEADGTYWHAPTLSRTHAETLT